MIIIISASIYIPLHRSCDDDDCHCGCVWRVSVVTAEVIVTFWKLPVPFSVNLHVPWTDLHNRPPSALHHEAATPHQWNSPAEVPVAGRARNRESTSHSMPPWHHRYVQSNEQSCTGYPMPRCSFLRCTISIHPLEHVMRPHRCQTFHPYSPHLIIITTTILITTTIIITESMFHVYNPL